MDCPAHIAGPAFVKAETRRRLTELHTWTGLIAGFALFIAFYAGALSVFHDEIDTWAVPHPPVVSSDLIARGDALMAKIVDEHPAARAQIGMTLPGDHPSHEVAVYWFDKDWHVQGLDDAKPRGEDDEREGLADFVYSLHYTLGIPELGIYLMGLVSIVYGVALLSGVLIHLPHLVQDLFALRPGRNLKRLWQDAHNVIGILSLPFHVIFAITGALICLMTIAMVAFNVMAFDGKLVALEDSLTGASPTITASKVQAPMLPPHVAVEKARAVALASGAEGFDPDYLRYLQYGDRNAAVEVRGRSGKTLGEYGSVALSAVDGRVLGVQVTGARDANHATYAAIFGLHFGTFGGTAVKWLYFLLGLAGAFLFYSGNLLYIESRRKRRSADQPLKVRAMATATVGLCLGSCSAIAVTFCANLVAAASGFDATLIVKPVFFAALAAAFGWTLWRRPARAAVDLLWLTAALSLAVAIADIALHGLRVDGGGAALAVNITCIGMAVGFASLARATARRAQSGDTNSVWAVAG